MSAFKFKMDGIQETVTRVQSFDKKFRRKWMRKAANEGSKVALKALKENAPPKKKDWGTGTWRKSLGRRVRVYASGSRVWYAVGPRSKFIANPVRKFRFWRDERGRVHKAPVKDYTPKYRPVNYSHLIEPKHHMIKRAMQSSQARQSNAIGRVLTDAMADV